MRNYVMTVGDAPNERVFTWVNVNEPCVPFISNYNGGTYGRISIAFDLTKCRYPFWEQLLDDGDDESTDIIVNTTYNTAWVYTSNSQIRMEQTISGAEFIMQYSDINNLMQQLREYFDESSSGQGQATLQVPISTRYLKFTSSLVQRSETLPISNNMQVSFLPTESQCIDIMWRMGSNTLKKSMMVEILDGEFSVKYADTDQGPIKGLLLTLGGSVRTDTRVSARYPTTSWTDYTDTIIVSNQYGRISGDFVFAKAAASIPFETAFVCHDNKFQDTTARAGRYIIKRDGTYVAGGTTGTATGEFITVSLDETNYAEVITVAPFTGVIKIVKANNAIVTMDASNGYSVSDTDVTIQMIFAIPA